ncbi:hypothetical protein [Wolbachia endosymbiont of Oedothorax gibbosus]|uniref:hypothetical protein n=1 Tax=Wolbachia endosymbiont of Oedothorax gibbosus TaxID=931100 RepID=UPI0020242B3F|nr:hypothetical protein [Wolbachia endosymbiont of Oedothorax gibbosus]
MELKIRKFPCPKKLKGVPENVLSIDLGKNIGLAYVKDNTLYCGSYVLNVEKWRLSGETLRRISDEYRGVIDLLLFGNQEMDLVLLEDNQYFFKQRYIRGSHMSYYKKLQMVVEGLFCLHWRGEVKRYFGGSLKKRCFGTARKEIVKDRIKKMLGVSGMNDHMTDGIAGLFAGIKREE